MRPMRTALLWMARNPTLREQIPNLPFAQRAVRWDMDNNVNRRMAYNHYFGQKAAAPAPTKKG